MGQHHVGTPCGLCICPDTDGGTVFERSNKVRHQFHVFYKFRHQSNRIGQVEAPVVYLTLNFIARNSYITDLIDDQNKYQGTCGPYKPERGDSLFPDLS